MGNSILLLGGGGHCLSVLDSLITNDTYDRIGIVDNNASEKNYPSGVAVVGTDEDLEKLYNEGWKQAFITVGSVGNTSVRRNLYEKITGIGFLIPSVIDKSATVAKSSVIEAGVFVGKGAVINANALIKKCSIINSGAIVEHECVIGEYSHISPGVTLCGNVSIGNDSHIGAGATVIQQIQVGKRVMVGAGSVVLRDISDGRKAYGNPCRCVEEIE